MKIALIGYGKMGRTIDRLATADGDEIVLRIDAKERLGLRAEDLKVADVIIEFSQPQAAVDNIQLALEAGVPIVCGTTGWLAEQDRITELVEEREGAFFYASNYSIGVNIFFALNRQLARMMNQVEGYTAALHETHHTQKVDAPSGTAITLAEGVINSIDGLKGWHLEKESWLDGSDKITSFGPVAPGEMPLFSYREGKVPGTHRIEYQSKEDSIRIEHEAHGREGFARGAIAAARWLVGRRGVFGMEDLLGY